MVSLAQRRRLRRVLLNLFYKIDRIHSFDIRHSTFCGSSVRFSIHSFDIRHSIFFGSAVLFLDPSSDIRYSAVLRFAFLYIPSTFDLPAMPPVENLTPACPP
jgi:hypothetical protein